VYQFSFLAPSPTLALTLVFLGDGGLCGTVSELRDGVEHKFSYLPRDEVCLVFGRYFLPFLSADKCWMEEDHSHFCSVHRPSSISARVCCCYRAGLLGRGPLGGSGMSTLAQLRWASFIWGHVLLPSRGTLACLSPGFARSQKGRCNQIVKLGGHDLLLTFATAVKKSHEVGSQVGLSLLSRQLRMSLHSNLDNLLPKSN
jgi:hypothetical protein